MQDHTMTDVEQKEWDLKLRRMDAEIAKMYAEGDELRARTAKQLRESTYYPLVVGSGATLAIVAIVKIFL